MPDKSVRPIKISPKTPPKAILGFGVFIVVDIVTKNVMYGTLAILLVNALIIFLYDVLWVRRVETIAMNKKFIKEYAGQAVVIMKRTSSS
jgi:hypothetical protein